jgi:hypothetical protein
MQEKFDVIAAEKLRSELLHGITHENYDNHRVAEHISDFYSRRGYGLSPEAIKALAVETILKTPEVFLKILKNTVLPN